MTLNAVRLVEHVHGHLGWLAAALLLHPAIVLRRRGRRAHLAVALATAFVTVAAAAGAWLYVDYRDHLRQHLFVSARTYGLLFERKEHLAFGALMFTWAGALSYVAETRAGDALRQPLRAIAFRSFACAAVLALVVALFGTAVAVYASF